MPLLRVLWLFLFAPVALVWAAWALQPFTDADWTDFQLKKLLWCWSLGRTEYP